MTLCLFDSADHLRQVDPDPPGGILGGRRGDQAPGEAKVGGEDEADGVGIGRSPHPGPQTVAGNQWPHATGEIRHDRDRNGSHQLIQPGGAA